MKFQNLGKGNPTVEKVNISRMNVKVIISLLSLLQLSSAFDDYVKVDHLEFSSLSNFTKHFFNSPHEKASTNVLVGFATPECADKVKLNAPLVGSQRHTGGYSFASASVIDVNFPVSLYDDCARIFFYSFNSSINEPRESSPILENQPMTAWIASQMRVNHFVLKNEFDYRIQVFWCDENKEPMFQFTLDPGQDTSIGTFLGHIFAARQEVDPNIIEWNSINPLVDFTAVKESEYIFRPLNRLETCENYIPVPNRRFVETEFTCDDMDTRYFEFSNQVWYQIRQGGNFFQPKMVQPVTENGFEKRRLPPETFKWLKEWYDVEKAAQEVTEGSSGPCMNQHVAPSGITHLSPDLKDKLSDELRSTLEDWYGGELELTSIYGIR